ncbi:hypothetical protein DPEC_G00192210 [Dallia pectoralis]|uniref:Uncharacterized protein n=1 Tax=Dallia pectoralis TaxID=75939 RepID=A0ACC2GCC9_DALPE|nr:hypothetical protein DPEC_G00192210 [Dallia pectoralis]
MAPKLKDRKRAPISHKVIEKRRRDRINRCLNELGKTVPMALAKQNSGKLEKAEILEMTVQYLRALHSADFPRGREKGELLAEFANYFHYGYHECMKNLVHYLTTEERVETKDIKYARILAFLQSKSRCVTEPVFGSLGASPADPPDYLSQMHSSPESHQSLSPSDSVFQQTPPGHLSWHSAARSPAISYPTVPLSAPVPQHPGYLSPVPQHPGYLSPVPQHPGYLSQVHGLDHHYFNLFNGHTHANAFSLQHAL